MQVGYDVFITQLQATSFSLFPFNICLFQMIFPGYLIFQTMQSIIAYACIACSLFLKSYSALCCASHPKRVACQAQF